MAKALREAKAKAPKMDASDSTETSGPAAAPASDAPSSGAATGTNSTDDPPESDDQGGAGNGAGSAESGEFDVAVFDQLQPAADRSTAEAEFRAKFPRFSAAMEAWQAEHENGEVPSGLRIAAKVDGFRRAGIAHSKSSVDHPVETFTSPEQLEALFAEPKLKVELI